MIAKGSSGVYIQRMNMSKQSTNIARLCASLILGFTQVSFAADPEPQLLEVPPPPVLRGPGADSYSGGGTGAKAASIGTGKTMGSGVTSDMAPSAPQNPSPVGKQSAFATTTNNEATKQNAATAAANAEMVEQARKAAAAAAIPSTITWGFQQFPTANTMYSSPQRK